MSRDGKNKFYSRLNLDKDTMKLIKLYRKWKKIAIKKK